MSEGLELKEKQNRKAENKTTKKCNSNDDGDEDDDIKTGNKNIGERQGLNFLLSSGIQLFLGDLKRTRATTRRVLCHTSEKTFS